MMLMFDPVTFLHYCLSPHSLDFQRSNHRAGPLARHAGSCSGQHPWIAPLGKRNRSDVCGHLLVEAWSRRREGREGIFPRSLGSISSGGTSLRQGTVSHGTSCWLNCTYLPLALADLLSNSSSLWSLTAQGCRGLNHFPKRRLGSVQ